MELTGVHQPMTSGQGMKIRKPYSAPGFKRPTRGEAKELLLPHANTHDPEVHQMLDRIEELEGEKGS